MTNNTVQRRIYVRQRAIAKGHVNLYGRYEFRKQRSLWMWTKSFRELAEIQIGTEIASNQLFPAQ